jgi:hypothetical protein
MPIETMSYDGNLFFTRMVGYADHIDIRRWGKALRKHADSSLTPTVAIVDLLEVTRICPTILAVCEMVSADRDVSGVWLVVGAATTVNNLQIIEALRMLPGIFVVSSVEKAMQAARSQLLPRPFSVGSATFPMICQNFFN